MNDKIFVGSVKSTIMQGGSGSWEKISISIGPNDFKTLEDHKNEKGWVNLLFKEGQSGKKYIEIDTWKPIKKDGFTHSNEPNYSQSNPTPLPEEDLPF